MHLSFLATAVLSIASVARAVNVDKESCERPNPWAPRTHAGMEWGNSPDENYFCEAGYIDGNVLTGIKVWRHGWGMFGFSFQWGELEWGRVYGSDLKEANEERVEFQEIREPEYKATWNSADDVQIKMRNNKNKDGNIDAVGSIMVIVNGKNVIDATADHITGQQLPIESGAGKIVALRGKSYIIQGNKNKPVQTLEFMFLESKIKSSTMTEIKFNEDINAWNKLKKGMELAAVMGEAWYVNDNPKGGLNQTFTNALSAKITTSQTLQSTRTHGFGITIGMKIELGADIIFLKSGSSMSIETKYEYTSSEMKQTTEEKSTDFSFTQGAQFVAGVPPQSATNCTITSQMGKFISDYTATISTRLENNKVFNFYERGTATTVNHVNTVSRCETIPLSDMPQGINGDSVKGSDVQTEKRAVEDEDVGASLLKRAIHFFA